MSAILVKSENSPAVTPLFRPLGNTTESSTPPKGKNTVEIVEFEALKEQQKYRKILEARNTRYALLENARELFFNEGVKEGLQYPNDYHRTAKCVRSTYEDVKIKMSTKHKKAFFTGVILCGMPWTCPVCSAKIQERRVAEVKKAIDKAYEENLKCIFVTFTFPHTKFDNLEDLIEKQKRAFKFFRSGNSWQKIKSKMNFKGLIRGLELTVSSANGWHPHTHEIWFVDKNTNAEELKEKVLSRWANCCKKAGLLTEKKTKAFYKHSIDIQDNATSSNYGSYIAESGSKWGADREVVKGNSKSSKGLHPFELLYQDNGMISQNISHKLFLEYARVMKGKRQLYWSQGLKDWAEVEEKTDKEIAEEKEDNAYLLGELNKIQWRIIILEKAQSLILEYAENGGMAKILRWFKNR